MWWYAHEAKQYRQNPTLVRKRWYAYIWNIPCISALLIVYIKVPAQIGSWKSFCPSVSPPLSSSRFNCRCQEVLGTFGMGGLLIVTFLDCCTHFPRMIIPTTQTWPTTEPCTVPYSVLSSLFSALLAYILPATIGTPAKSVRPGPFPLWEYLLGLRQAGVIVWSVPPQNNNSRHHHSCVRTCLFALPQITPLKNVQYNISRNLIPTPGPIENIC